MRSLEEKGWKPVSNDAFKTFTDICMAGWQLFLIVGENILTFIWSYLTRMQRITHLFNSSSLFFLNCQANECPYSS